MDQSDLENNDVIYVPDSDESVHGGDDEVVVITDDENDAHDIMACLDESYSESKDVLENNNADIIVIDDDDVPNINPLDEVFIFDDEDQNIEQQPTLPQISIDTSNTADDVMYVNYQIVGEWPVSAECARIFFNDDSITECRIIIMELQEGVPDAESQPMEE